MLKVFKPICLFFDTQVIWSLVVGFRFQGFWT